MILFSFLPIIRTHYWWIRILDFPRVQVATFCLAILGIYAFTVGISHTIDYVFAVLLIAATINEVVRFFPFTFLSPVQAKSVKHPHPLNQFSFMISNVRMENDEYKKFLELVKKTDPDMLLINEPDNRWQQALQELDVKYPFCVKKPQENTYGMMFYSKLEIVNSEINFLVEDGIPSFNCLIKMNNGFLFELFTVHPQPPRFRKDTDKREAELILVAKRAKESKYPVIVAGDLNDVAWSHTTRLFQRISGLLDPRVGRGFYNTYNAHVPFFRYSLDHIFYDRSFSLVELKRLSYFGSDHFPILIKLSHEPQKAKEQEVPKADLEDKQEANEMIRDGFKDKD